MISVESAAAPIIIMNNVKTPRDFRDTIIVHIFGDFVIFSNNLVDCITYFASIKYDKNNEIAKAGDMYVYIKRNPGVNYNEAIKPICWIYISNFICRIDDYTDLTLKINNSGVAKLETILYDYTPSSHILPSFHEKHALTRGLC